MSHLDELVPEPEKFTERDERHLRQLDIERQGQNEGYERYQTRIVKARAAGKDVTNFQPESKLVRQAMSFLTLTLEDYQKNRLPSLRGRNLGFPKDLLTAIFKRCLTTQLAFITIRSALNSGLEGNNLSNFCVKLGRQVLAHYDFLRFVEHCPGYVKVVLENLKTKHLGHKHRVLTALRIKQGITSTHLNRDEYLAIGRLLTDLMIQSTGLFEIQNRTTPRKDKFLTEVTIVASKETKDYLDEGHMHEAMGSPIEFPMLVPPLDWTDLQTGGFLLNIFGLSQNNILVQTPERNMAKIDLEKMKPVMDAVNTLQKTPYRINRSVLDVIKGAWGTGLGNLPLRPKAEMIPAPPWGSDEEFEQMKADEDPRLMAWKRKAAKAYSTYHNMETQRQTLCEQVRIAEMFKEEPELFFVYFLDWRGRVYPVQSMAPNPQSDDRGRALIEFADALPLTDEDGVFWFKVHGANQYGVDKLSFKDRAKWVDENEGFILECAQDPFTFRFWEDADKGKKCYQFLAWCFEYAEFVKQGRSPQFKSRIPVQLDASCSGTQHFAALLLDEKTGSDVNLTPHEVPADIYAIVAEKVTELLNADRNAPMDGQEQTEKNRFFASAWLAAGDGKITRQWTKRNTMTLSYSATLYGFQKQLDDELRQWFERHDKRYINDPDHDDWAYAGYLAKKNLEAIKQVIVKPFVTMEELQKMARAVAEAGSDLIWETPSGFTVIQDYRKTKLQRVKTFWGETKIRRDLGLKRELDEKDARMFSQGIAPNFIHSLDAAHLILTVNACAKAGVKAFAMVHDSFGTHACHISTLNRLVREEFVKMYHDTDLLNQFRVEVVSQVPEGTKLPEFASRGKLDVRMVNNSQFFFA
jgi:DNA-directed RNA polymerase, mitochondrial